MANYQLEQTGAEVQALLNAVESPDTTPAAGSSNLITSGAVQAAVAGVSAEVTALGQKVGNIPGEIDVFGGLAGLKWDGTKVSAANATFNGIVFQMEEGAEYEVVAPPFGTSGWASITTYPSMPQINDVATRLITSSGNPFTCNPGEKYALVTLYIQSANSVSIKYLSRTGIERYIPIIENNVAEINQLSKTVDGINREITNSTLVGLRWDGSAVAASSTLWNAVVIQLIEGVRYKIITPQDPATGYASALSFGSYPEVGDTNALRSFTSTTGVVAEPGENYLLVTFRTDVLSGITYKEIFEGIGQKVEKTASLQTLMFLGNTNIQRKNAIENTTAKLRDATLYYTILGDSITDTWSGHNHAGGGASDAAHGYPQIVHRWLKDRYGSTIQFVNNGTGGHKVSDALLVFDTYITPYNFDLVGLALGTNDWNVQTSLATFEANYRQLIAKVQDDTNAEFFIIGLGYFNGWKESTHPITAKDYNDVLYKLSKEFDVPFVCPFYAMEADIDMGNRTFAGITYASDPVHPNDAGHLIWAAETYKAITM